MLVIFYQIQYASSLHRLLGSFQDQDVRFLVYTSIIIRISEINKINTGLCKLEINSFSDTCIGTVCASVWTGGTDEANEGNFIWTGSNEIVQFENWAQNNPNNYDQNEHCIRLFVYGKWSDYNCDTIMAFICEKTVNK